jgi:hypothetical protein
MCLREKIGSEHEEMKSASQPRRNDPLIRTFLTDKHLWRISHGLLFSALSKN